MRLLDIQSSPRGESSDSIGVLKAVGQRLNTLPYVGLRFSHLFVLHWFVLRSNCLVVELTVAAHASW